MATARSPPAHPSRARSAWAAGRSIPPVASRLPVTAAPWAAVAVAPAAVAPPAVTATAAAAGTAVAASAAATRTGVAGADRGELLGRLALDLRVVGQAQSDPA